ncbi:BURP domain protein RD22 isoform X2 [Ricinus communis]|uniref:BURP domain-containing protein n=1 Tax=Ricinus communis TaxID=3988 RepID=B9RIH5_RICCO|nr:BURP domain protein RD22 isoform X2 [Ricinus communis]EEF48947.1 conserved hypothetical protein [Ricinus communis]|eukprot:XP_025012113.1 BURP domain protein RD22-like [Ricinus communis]
MTLSVSSMLWQVVVARSDASLLAEEYWQSVLPNTPISKALQELLVPDVENKNTSPDIPNWILYQKFTVLLNLYMVKHLINLMKLPTQQLYSSCTRISILVKRMNLLFTKFPDKVSFLPRQVANSIPFSSNKLPGIIDRFSINTKSAKANLMRQTLEECESPKVNGEDKFCATSLESLVDFGVSRLGRNVIILSNEIDQDNKKQEYSILTGIKMVGDKQNVCHKEVYAYAGFIVMRYLLLKLIRFL